MDGNEEGTEMEAFKTFLWFNDQAEEAARFYTSVFKDGAITAVQQNTEAGPGPVGTVMLVEFELNGQKFIALNGGPTQFSFNESVSVMVTCEDQAEVDYYWDALTADGGRENACGWVYDKYGLCWQVAPTAFFDLIKGPDKDRAARVVAAMLQMKKLDIAALERA
jgi:predicted 3-demethylubiquinone-9 3-methyltransferase (glyoxalase superfamily)